MERGGQKPTRSCCSGQGRAKAHPEPWVPVPPRCIVRWQLIKYVPFPAPTGRSILLPGAQRQGVPGRASSDVKSRARPCAPRWGLCPGSPTQQPAPLLSHPAPSIPPQRQTHRVFLLVGCTGRLPSSQMKDKLPRDTASSPRAAFPCPVGCERQGSMGKDR